jgi:hypothetical protein
VDSNDITLKLFLPGEGVLPLGVQELAQEVWHRGHIVIDNGSTSNGHSRTNWC